MVNSTKRKREFESKEPQGGSVHIGYTVSADTAHILMEMENYGEG